MPFAVCNHEDFKWLGVGRMLFPVSRGCRRRRYFNNVVNQDARVKKSRSDVFVNTMLVPPLLNKVFL